MHPINHIVLGLVLVLIAAGCGDPAEEARGPNVLLVVMDTTRADRCSLQGYHRETTPNLERIARDATVFVDAWSPTSWTGPAHASLFTGLRPEHHGFRESVRFYLNEDSITLSDILGERGYETACLTNNPQISQQNGLAQGFDLYECPNAEDEEADSSAAGSTDRALELATRWHGAGRPFFLFVNDWEPHLPYDPPEEMARRFLPADAHPGRVADLRKFRATLRDLYSLSWRNYRSRDWAVLSDLYDAEIATVDREIGRLVRGLDESGILENTILIVTSDHGENLGDHGLCSHVFSLHRTLLHVPLLIRYPPRFPPGKRAVETARLEDLLPTILDVCGISPPEGLDGRSLLDPGGSRPSRALLDCSIEPHIERDFPAFGRTKLWEAIRSVYDGRHHLIQWRDGREELYDIQRDPEEMRPLLSGNPALRERLRGLLPDAW